MRTALATLIVGCTVPTLAITPLPFQTAPLHGQAPVEIQEWDVPWQQTRPRDPYVAPDGQVWFVGQRDDYVAVLDPSSGDFERFELPENAGPHNLIVDDEGIIWYAGNRDRHIGRLDPESGEIERFEMPDAGARDPHTLIFGEDGRIYFTVQGGNRVGRLDPATGAVEIREVPTPDARPYGIVQTPDGTVWVAEFGTNKLAAVDPETLEIEEIELPRADARARRLQPTSDGRIWYVDYAGGQLGVLDPATREFREWALPGGDGSRPYGMAVDARDRLWIVESGSDPNQLVGFDPTTESFIGSTPIPSGAGTVRHMYYHEPTNSIWFGTDANTVGQARLR